MTKKHIPAPLTEGHLCKDCGGTGADIKKTLRLRSWETGYVRCWSGNGGGLDPAEYFRWGPHPELPAFRTSACPQPGL